MGSQKILLVGDNPFHGVSHLSQDRARGRSQDITSPEYCAGLVRLAMENGADGFMFSISEMTLSILRILNKWEELPRLYAIAPAASDYVRLASRLGTPGLALYLARQILLSGNFKAIADGFKGIVGQNPISLMKAYIFYELYRIKAATTQSVQPHCLMLHEIVTEMALALNLEWLFRSYIDFMLGLKIKPGFETRNLPYLVDKFTTWGIDLDNIALVAPFNAAGFQMSPYKAVCENALTRVAGAEVIAMSILASGYLKMNEATEYINSLSRLSGVVVGISKEQHAHDLKILKMASATI
jgi:hypothetical protein